MAVSGTIPALATSELAIPERNIAGKAKRNTE